MPDELITLAELLTEKGFLGGAAAGAVGLLILYAGSRVSKTTTPGWALALVAGAMAALMPRLGLERGLVAFLDFGGGLIPGLVLLAVSGGFLDLADSLERGRTKVLALGWAWALLLGASIWLTAQTEISDLSWVQVAAPAVVILIGWALRSYGNSPGGVLLGPMFALSVFGIWATVPDTEMVGALLGVTIFVALATLPWIDARPTGAGAFALSGLLVWLVASGGADRPASIIAGWAAAGVLLLIPVLRMSSRPGKPVGLLGLHLFVVWAASRPLGSLQSVAVTLAGIAALFAFAGVALRILPVSITRPESVGDPPK